MESDWLKANFIVTEVYDEEPEQKKPKNKFNLKKSNDKKKKIISSDDESSEEEVTKKNKVSQKVLTDELLYKAPELLKNPIYPHLKLGFKDKPDLSKLRVDMQYADAYSVGMIFYEILYRLRIFEVERDDMEGLIDVLSGKYYKQTKTPQIPYIEGNPKETNPSIVAILQQCFDNDPSMRPNIKKIKKVFQTVLKIKGNLVDSVISMMDRYAVDLERTVKDRTKMLEDAQERADRLLSQMLPPEVATLLKNGKTFEPRIFKSTSLVFTDICSFTKICAQSSPIQIVTFLNNLFTGYDTIVDKYDAYKISTVGDCYIVLSKENGSMHAKIIASIALAMKGFLDKYTLPHMPTHVMKARWGLHSGPVATGIVGLQAPRYCIFGDTVNIASKMESSGVPSQIQMSVETRDLIKSRRDPFITKKRGQVSVKKNLDWTTYWLLGYTVNETASTDKDHDNTSDVEE
uniref:Guanylate cyclase n=1 Tax=Rhabditophanes sp. KR3021 TaxID=114890 RepID=A0AC35TKS6_9BILA